MPVDVHPKPEPSPSETLTPMDTTEDGVVEEQEQEEEDVVVREIDVFLNPSPLDENTSLYVMQYPLRPYWRPYELGERCENVRMKPKQMEIEFDLSIDTESENYDDNYDPLLEPKFQTLSSSKVPLATSYAVGILEENQLHLNPLPAVVQLRPSMQHIRSTRPQDKKIIVEAVGAGSDVKMKNLEQSSKPTSTQKKSAQGSEMKDADTPEEWVPLEFYPTENPCSSGYRQKMIAKQNGAIQFHMKLHDYVDNLCPATSSSTSARTGGPSKEMLLSMPLAERLRVLFSEGSKVLRFDTLMHYAPSDSKDDVLDLLPNYADFVQGLWVSKSSLFCEGRDTVFRDYVLLLFSKSNRIPSEEVKWKSDVQMRILGPLARGRPSLNDWKFKEPTDISFIKSHPHIVRQQEVSWTNRDKGILDAYHTLRRLGTAAKDHFKPSPANPNSTPSGIKNGAQRLREKSDGAREAVPKAVVKVLRNYKVCGLNMIRQRLQEMALSDTTLPKVDSRSITSAAIDIIASPKDFKDIINQVAIQIHDVYVLKSLNDPALDPFRNVVINLYRGKEPKAKLKKAEICTAAKMELHRDISNAEYNQVMNELCVSHKGGGWVLKSGDGPD